MQIVSCVSSWYWKLILWALLCPLRESIKRVEFKVFENERDNWTFCYIFATIPAPAGISVVSRNVVVYKAQQKVNTSKQNKQSNAV